MSQSNPYPTPVLRGIMGSASTLLFTTLGAVALLSSVALRLLRRSRRKPTRAKIA